MDKAILLSIKPYYSLSIQNGLKTVELRKRFPIDSCGMKVFIYTTKPIGAIIGYFIISSIVLLPITKLWTIVKDKANLNKEVYFDYFKSYSQGYGIFFNEYISLNHEISLAEIRNFFPQFYPPQNYQYVSTRVCRQLINSNK